MRKSAKAIAALSMAAWAASASASLLVYEPFDYTYTTPPPGTPIAGQTNTYSAAPETWWNAGTVGATVHQVGSPGLSGGVQPNIGNMADLKAADYKELLRMNVPNAFNTDATPKYGKSSTLYYSLLLDIQSIGAMTVANTNTAANNAFLIGFNNTQQTASSASEPNSWSGELVIRKGLTTGSYDLGIRGGGAAGSVTTWTSSDITPGTTPLFIVVQASIDANADSSSISGMWINPDSSTFGADEGTRPAPTYTANGIGAASGWNMESIMIGAGENVAKDAPDDVYMDEIRVGDTWADVTTVPEPSSIAVVGMGLMTMAGKRRHRRCTT